MRGGSRAGRAAENSELGRHRSVVEPPLPSPPPRQARVTPRWKGIFPRYRLVGFCGTPGRPRSQACGGAPGAGAWKSRPMQQYSRSEPSCRSRAHRGGRTGATRARRQVPATRLRRGGRRVSASGTRFESDPTAQRAARHSDFMTEVRSFEKYLREPDVGLRSTRSGR